jgi:uncharacterized protein (TIGR02217 family)
MSNAVFPALIGVTFPIARKPVFSTRVQQSVSGREVRITDYPYPIWEWTLPFDYLPAADFATLAGFIAARQGPWDSFLYDDPTDDSVSGQAIGTGDGSTAAWQLVRALGSFAEPILAPNVVQNVYLNGVRQAAGSYSVNAATGVVTFNTAPGSGAAISADFTYYFRCCFLDDVPAFEQFMHNIWRAKELKFRSLFL